MKIFTLLPISFLFVINTFAFSGGGLYNRKAAEIYLPVGVNMRISLADLSVIKEKDFEKINGKRLGFFERLAFSSSQKKLRNSINTDGTINNKKLLKAIQDGHSKKFQAGGFFLGFLGGPIGVLIAYLINDGQKKNRIKWAWIGWGLGTLVALIFIIIALQALSKSFDSLNFNFI